MCSILALVLAAYGLAALGQPVPSFPARAERVVVDVVVTDRDGSPILGLSPSDFEVSDDGERQRIASFEAVAPRPPRAAGSEGPVAQVHGPSPPGTASGQSYVVAFDDVNMTPFKAGQAKAAIASFLRSLAADDRVLLLSTSTGEGLLAGSEAERRDLLSMLPGLKAGHLPDSSPDRMSDYEAMLIDVLRDADTQARVARRISARSGPGGSLSITALAAEAYLRATGRIRDTLRTLGRLLSGMSGEPGRKSVILVSEGFILEPRIEEFREVTQAAMRVNAVLYFVDARQLNLGSAEYPAEFNALGVAGDLAPSLAEETGATVGSETLATDTGGFSIRNTNDLAEGMRRIGAEARTYYLLGYDTAKEPDGKFRKIRVKVGRKGVRVRARKGYYAERRPAPAGSGR